MSKLNIVLLILLLSTQIASADWLNVTSSKDTYVNDGSTSSNYGGISVTLVGNFTGAEYHAYYGFDISTLPSNIVINNATLSVYENSITHVGLMDVKYITSSWEEYAVTWDTMPSYGDTIDSINVTANGYNDINVTSAIQSFHNGSVINNGFVLINQTSVADTYSFFEAKEEISGLKPYLNISYTVIPGSAISGTVYEIIGGSQVPISGTTVRIWNNYSTYSDSILVGSTGAYVFTGLENNATYYLQASHQPQYVDSAIEIVTVGDNESITRNIRQNLYVSPYVPNFVFEKFIVRDLFDTPYPGVTVNIYKGDEVTTSFTGTTDSMGQAVFQLIKDQRYRLELTGGGIPTNITNYFYGKEETYLITITNGFPTTGDKFEDINATLYVTEINATHANLSLYYNDNSSTTTAINFYATYYINGTAACAPQNASTNSTTFNCTVVMDNFTYLFGWNATTTKYGFIQGADVVNFKAQNADAQIVGIENVLSEDMLHWLSILSIIFVAGLFSAKSVKFAVIVVPGVATILYWLGTLQINAFLVHTALILGVMIYMRMSERKAEL